jgi:hypothetical protein
VIGDWFESAVQVIEPRSKVEVPSGFSMTVGSPTKAYTGKRRRRPAVLIEEEELTTTVSPSVGGGDVGAGVGAGEGEVTPGTSGAQN